MFSDVTTYVFEYIFTRCRTNQSKFCPCICNSFTQCDKYWSHCMPRANTNNHRHTQGCVAKCSLLGSLYPHWCLVYFQHTPLSYSDLSRQLNTLTLPFLTSVTWHSHLWLPLHTLKPMNSHSPKTHSNTDQIYTLGNSYSFERERKRLRLHT